MQQVNLYLDEFKHHEPILSSAVIVIICGYMVFIGVLVSIISYGVLVHMEKENEVLQRQADYWQEQLQIAFRQNPEPSIDESLLKEIGRIEDQVIRNHSVLRYLKQRQEDFENQSFSVFLLALTWVKQPDLWLTKVAIKRSGKSLTLTGRALQSDALPDYLNKLSTIEVFKNMTFQVFDLQRDGKEYKFIVSSDAQEKNNETVLESVSP